MGDEDTNAVVSGVTDWMKKKLSTKNSRSGATGMGTKTKPRTEAELKKAQELDPTIFLYDENVEIDKAAKEKEVASKKEVDRKPKYIANLLKHAKVREKENERRIERQVQKERDAEGDEFADKEKFVTSAYRKKMEEMQKLDEGEKKKDRRKKLKLKSKKNLWTIRMNKDRKRLKKLTYNCPKRPNRVNDHTDVEIQNLLMKKMLLRM